MKISNRALVGVVFFLSLVAIVYMVPLVFWIMSPPIREIESPQPVAALAATIAAGLAWRAVIARCRRPRRRTARLTRVVRVQELVRTHGPTGSHTWKTCR